MIGLATRPFDPGELPTAIQLELVAGALAIGRWDGDEEQSFPGNLNRPEDDHGDVPRCHRPASQSAGAPLRHPRLTLVDQQRMYHIHRSMLLLLKLPMVGCFVPLQPSLDVRYSTYCIAKSACADRSGPNIDIVLQPAQSPTHDEQHARVHGFREPSLLRLQLPSQHHLSFLCSSYSFVAVAAKEGSCRTRRATAARPFETFMAFVWACSPLASLVKALRK